MIKLKPFALLAVLVLSACGFQLRTAVHLPEDLSPLFIHGEGITANALRQRLSQEGVEITDDIDSAKLQVYLENEKQERRILSVSAISSKLEEIELNHQLSIKVEDKNGKALLSPQRLERSRYFSFDSQRVLAKAEEEATLRQELQQSILNQVLRYIALIKPQ